jgi:VanZ family protein
MITLLEKHSKLSWTLTLIVAVIIFYMSTLTFGVGIGDKSSNIKSIMYHFTAFFFLSFFLLVSLTKGKNIKLIYLGLIIAILYGILDEVHQMFVPERAFAFLDIFIDSLGILSAGLIYSISINPKEYHNKKSIKKLDKYKIKTIDIKKQSKDNNLKNTDMERAIKGEFE